MTIVDATDERCCCTCLHNVRKSDEKQAGIYCECDIDKHYIYYVACFEQVCDEYESEGEK